MEMFICKSVSEFGAGEIGKGKLVEVSRFLLFSAILKAFKSEFKSDYFDAARRLNSLCFDDGVEVEELGHYLHGLLKTQQRDNKRFNERMGQRREEARRLEFWLDTAYRAFIADLDMLVEEK